jgi:hypothetical protein
MKILNKLKIDREPIYYTWPFFNEVEANLIKLISVANIETLVDDVDLATYRGDFYGWLKYKFPAMDQYLYWVTLRVNRMLSPHDFNEKIEVVRTFSDTSELGRLVAKTKEVGYTSI